MTAPNHDAASVPQAAGCTCSGYYVDGRAVLDQTRCPIHSPEPAKLGGGVDGDAAARGQGVTGATPAERPAASVPRSEWEWFGNAAHFICGSDCRFHMATLVGPWIVSTVGQYLPDSSTREILAKSRGIVLEGRGDYRRASWMKQAGFEQIGSGRTFETMVFRAGERCTVEDCGCGLPALDPPSELDSDAYNDAGSATRGHYAMCEKWASIDAADAERVANAWRDDA